MATETEATNQTIRRSAEEMTIATMTARLEEAVVAMHLTKAPVDQIGIAKGGIVEVTETGSETIVTAIETETGPTATAIEIAAGTIQTVTGTAIEVIGTGTGIEIATIVVTETGATRRRPSMSMISLPRARSTTRLSPPWWVN